MKVSFTPSADIPRGSLVELTTAHDESTDGIPALFVDGEFIDVFVAHIPCPDPPPLYHEWLAEHEKPQKAPTPIKKQKRVYASQKRGRTRLAVFRRDGFRCRYCGDDLLSDPGRFISASLDHFVPKTHRESPTTMDGLVTCCYACNQIKGGEYFDTFEEAREFILAERRRRFVEALAERYARRRTEGWSIIRRPWAVLAGCLGWLMLWPGHSAT